MTQKQQRKAGRLRRKLREGKPLSKREAAFLARYDAEVTPRRPRVAPAAPEADEGDDQADDDSQEPAAEAAETPVEQPPTPEPDSAPPPPASDQPGEPAPAPSEEAPPADPPPPISMPAEAKKKTTKDDEAAAVMGMAVAGIAGLMEMLKQANLELADEGYTALSPAFIDKFVAPAAVRAVERYLPKDLIDEETADLALVGGAAVFTFVQHKRMKKKRKATQPSVPHAGAAAMGAPDLDRAQSAPPPAAPSPPKPAPSPADDEQPDDADEEESKALTLVRGGADGQQQPRPVF